MKNLDYHSSIAANVTPKEAFAGIANVGGWWAKNFKGSALKKGDTFTVEFGKTNVNFEITEAIPEKKSVWKVTDCYLDWLNDKKEWKGTEVVWEIASKGAETQIDMTHVGLTPDVECYNDCFAGWNGHINGSLNNLLKDGKGQPE